MHRSLAGLAALTLVLCPVPLAAQTPPGPPPNPPSGETAPTPPPSPTPAPGATPTAPAPDAAKPEQAPEISPAPAPPAAEPEPAIPSPATVRSDVDVEPTIVPAARDTLGGHFVLGASAAIAVPFGMLDSDTASSDPLELGPGFGLDAGVGVSRTVVLGAYGQLVLHGSPDGCQDCSATSIGAGLFVRYHLVQGVRFDPWISAGVGYRGLTVSDDDLDLGYSGLDWLKLSVGGDWYPLSVFGFGPFVELDLGTYLNPRNDTDPAVYANFLAGARVVLDFPGK